GGRLYEGSSNNFIRPINSGSALSQHLTVGHSYRQNDGTWVKYLGSNGRVGGGGMPDYSLHRFRDLGTHSPVRKQAPVAARRPVAPSGSGHGWIVKNLGP